MSVEMNKLILPDINGNDQEFEIVDKYLRDKLDYQYHVGMNQDYQTINAAVNKWKSDGRPPAIIYIANGTYKEKVDLQGVGSNLSFIGESKEGVIWKQTTGYYPDCPLTISGNNLIANITFISDISDNPDYEYVQYSGGNTGAAYALHLDAPNAAGVIHVYNCDLISYVNAAIGCGTCEDRTLIIENCNLISLGDYATNSNGALLYHGDSGSGVTGQKLILKNNKFYHEHSALAVYLQNIGDTLVDIEMLYNTLDSGAFTSNDALVTSNFQKTTEGFNVLKTSVGNNVERMNYIDSSWQKHKLTDYQGFPFLNATDLNELKGTTVVFKANNAIGTLNTPLTGDVAFMGINIAYTINSYAVQYAWQLNAVPPKLWKRSYYVDSGWSAWKLCAETLDDINDRLYKTYTNTVATGSTGNIPLSHSVTDYKLESAVVNGYPCVPFASGGNWFLKVLNDNMTPLASTNVTFTAIFRKMNP